MKLDSEIFISKPPSRLLYACIHTTLPLQALSHIQNVNIVNDRICDNKFLIDAAANRACTKLHRVHRRNSPPQHSNTQSLQQALLLSFPHTEMASSSAPTSFRDWIKADGSTPYTPERGRYHLYVAWVCPW